MLQIFEVSKSSRISGDQYLLRVECDHDTDVTGVCLCSDGHQVASCTKDGMLCLWDTATGGLLSQHRGKGEGDGTLVRKEGGERKRSMSQGYVFVLSGIM